MTGRATASAIIVNWNGAEHLRTCLPSLREQSYEPLEIVVVDNASSDGSREVAERHGARWLPLKQNMGLAPALNRGAASARGELLLFVNNDMRFDRDFVAHLADMLEADGDIFAADGRQYNWEGSAVGHAATRLSRRRPDGTTSVELVPGLYFYQQPSAEQTDVFMASAASMLVQRKKFEALGGCDERLPRGYEDAEICWRAWLRSWRVVYAPGAVCWHRVGASGRSREGARRNFRGILRGRLLLATKLLPARYATGAWMVSAAGLARDLGRMRPGDAADRLAVLFASAREMPRLLRERWSLFDSAGTTPGKHLKRMLRLTLEDEDGRAARNSSH